MPKSASREYQLIQIGPPPEWWAEQWAPRQMEIRRRVQLILSTRGPTSRLAFLREFGAFQRREVDHALWSMDLDLVIDRDGDFYRLRQPAAKKA
jgi:hypothetical protein